MSIRVEMFEKPKLRNPIMICGLPGMGYVAKLSVDYLIEELDAKLFAEIYSDFFPPCIFSQGGMMDQPRNELYYWKGTKDIIFYTGNVQPEGGGESVKAYYDLSSEVVRIANEFGVRRIFTMAAYVSEHEVQRPRVFGVVSRAELRDEVTSHGVILMQDGGITGINGLLIGVGELMGIPGICLLGETSTPDIADPSAAFAVLSVLVKMLEIDVDLQRMRRWAKEYQFAASIGREMRRRIVEEEEKPEYIR